MLAQLSDPASQADASEPAPELYVVINPGSGEHDLMETRQTLARVFGDAGRRHRFVAVDVPEQLGQASDEAARQARDSGAVLVAVGGDGTINTVAQAAWRTGCVLGVLPRGTFNLFGRQYGISQDLEAAARALLSGRPQPVQVGEVNGRVFLVNASLGMYPQLLQDRETFKNQFGRHRWVALLAGLVTLFQWRRQLTLEIELDGQRRVVKTPTAFVGNNRLQLERIGWEPSLAARVGEGRLAGLVAKPIGSWTMVWLMLRGAFGRLGDAQQVHDFVFRSLTVRVLGRRRVKVAADGEVAVMTPPLRFAVGERPLLLVVPREEDRVPVE